MMKKIKVLHIIKSLGRGGAEVLLPETLHFHDKDKFEFHYIYFFSWKKDVVEEIEQERGIITCLNIQSNIGILIKSIFKIRKYCKQNKIDIIHIHSPLVSIPIRIFKFLIKKPICYTEHNLINKYNIFTKKLNYITYNLQDCIIACSEPVKDSIIKYKKNIKAPIIKVSNGINTQKYNPQTTNDNLRKDLNIPENAIVVLIIAVFRPQKRLNLWLEIVNETIKKNKNIYGIIVGGGPLEEELKEQHKALENSKQILFTGKQMNVKPFLNISDIFMMTSEFEGLPVSLLEAMSSGLAVVSTNVGGLKNVIRKNIDGFTSDVNNYKELSTYILNLANDKNLLLQYKEKARNRVVKNFNIEKMTKQLEDIYIKLYNGNKKI